MELNSANIRQQVTQALQDDIGDGDITAQLLPVDKHIKAEIISRDKAIICGQAWVNEVFQQVNTAIQVEWLVQEGEQVQAGQRLCALMGLARDILTAERCALNFLQTLSATASITHHYVQLIAGSKAIILDTRKTIPGLRYAQKHAVTVGGGQNHRLGLYDAFLIKENHIMACGSIAEAVEKARAAQTNKKIEVEVESIDELQQAITVKPDVIMLDNFSIDMLKDAVKINQQQVKLEASGNVNESTIAAIAATGVDYISVGALTKNIAAIDLSMRLLGD